MLIKIATKNHYVHTHTGIEQQHGAHILNVVFRENDFDAKATFLWVIIYSTCD